MHTQTPRIAPGRSYDDLYDPTDVVLMQLAQAGLDYRISEDLLSDEILGTINVRSTCLFAVCNQTADLVLHKNVNKDFLTFRCPTTTIWAVTAGPLHPPKASLAAKRR